MTAEKSSAVLMRVLLVEDNHRHRQMLKEVLYGKCDVDSAVHFTQAKEKLKKQQYDLVLLDLMLPQREGAPVMEDGSLGLSLLRLIRETEPLLPVVVISAMQNTATTIQILRLGIVDFIVKDELEDQLAIVLKRATLIRQGRVDNLLLRHYQNTDHSGNFVYADKSMKAIDEQISILANDPSSILLLGESGTGKEVIAREIHRRGSRSNDPFIDINCGAIPEHLLESELFGHEKGAFTGADRMKSGLIELAHNGTLLLDEIADLSQTTQVKLLRFLQERTFRRIGGSKNLAVDVRIIAATNKDLAKEMTEGRFREDLYYRLSGVILQVPPLRERKGDIPLLVDSFLKSSPKGSTISLEPKAMKSLLRYDWPGNVRELQSFVQRLVIISPGKLVDNKLVVSMLPKRSITTDSVGTVASEESVIDNLSALERATIVRVLTTSKNQVAAMKRLGISESTLRRKIKEHLIGSVTGNKSLKTGKELSQLEHDERSYKGTTTEVFLKHFRKGDTFSIRQAMERLGGVSRKHATAILNNLIKSGMVFRVARGCYVVR